MSTRTVIIWLGVALVLGAVALYVARRPTPAENVDRMSIPAGERVFGVEAASVRGLNVRTPDGREQRVLRAEEPGEWVVTLSPDGPRWPLLAARMRSTLTILATVNSEAAAGPAASLGDNPTVVTIELDSGEAIVARLAERTLGGTGLIEIERAGEKRRAMVGSNVLDLFRNPGPRGWRDNLALAGTVPADASRIRVESADGRAISLVRSDARWRLAEPVAAPANPTKVNQVLAALAGLAISDFLDDRRTDPAMTKLDAPAVRVFIETDRRLPAPDPGAAPTVHTSVHGLSIGGAADSTGKNLFAAVSRGNAPARTVSVDAAGLAATLTADPAAYIAQTATAVTPADVGSVTLAAAESDAGRRFKRSLGAWAEVLPGGREAQLTDADVNAVNEALTFLASHNAASVYAAPPEGYRRVGTVTLGSLADSPLDAVEIGVLSSGNLALRSGPVVRAYAMESAPRLLRDWTAAVAGNRPAEPPLGVPADINK